jgi:hypothetical protein
MRDDDMTRKRCFTKNFTKNAERRLFLRSAFIYEYEYIDAYQIGVENVLQRYVHSWKHIVVQIHFESKASIYD